VRSEEGQRSRPEGARLADALGLVEADGRDRLTILAGTAQNVVGLAVFVVASFAMNILIARAFGGDSAAFGQVTLATQLAFVAGAATRFGMDMASVRRVAIEVGKGEPGRSRAIVRIAVLIALGVSAVVAAAAFLLAAPLASFLNAPRSAFRVAAVALVFVALAQVYLGGSRGLKIMRHTLYAYWVGQPISWIALTLIAWTVMDKTVAVTVFTYALSWVVSTVLAWFLWQRETAGFERMPAESREARALLRYGAPRAPAALLSQALFYTDFFVLSHYLPGRGPDLSVYAAAVRVAQALVLFLTAVAYMFSPFVADLHERGERERLDGLFKAITRWTLAGTIPLLLLFVVAPGPVLKIFGSAYSTGTSWLRILLVGQIVNVSVGAAGFVLIMIGRTGWDLLVYASSFLLDLVVAVVLVRRLGPQGAAIAQATTLVFSNVFRLLLVWRFARIQPYDRHYLRLAAPTALGLLAMVGLHALLSGPKWGIDLLGTGLVGGLVYYIAFLLLGLAPGEKATIRRILRRRRGRPTVATIRALDEEDGGWLRALQDERWGGQTQVVNGIVYQPADQEGFVAVSGTRRVGVVTYEIEGGACMIGLLQSLDEGHGVATRLVEAVTTVAKERGCSRLWAVTTNDNTRARAFYERLGFRVAAVREGAVTESRRLKPTIPLVDESGVPITDEIELERSP
jgi:O-antigen/teichoic acid export membrane protein/ribosomal protein S18 acetylase RimI-like enzyme